MNDLDPSMDGGVGVAAAMACGMGIRALAVVGPLFGVILGTVAVCTLAMFVGATESSP
jgi:uncharacterized membrane protein